MGDPFSFIKGSSRYPAFSAANGYVVFVPKTHPVVFFCAFSETRHSVRVIFVYVQRTEYIHHTSTHSHYRAEDINSALTSNVSATTLLCLR